MGILTSVLSELARQTFDEGFRLLDRQVTDLMQQGRDKEAASLLNATESQLTHNLKYPQQDVGQNLMGGTGGVLSGAMQPVQQNFQNYTGGNGQMNLTSPEATRIIGRASPTIQQMIFNKYQQDLIHNPAYAQQELEQKMAETGISAAGTAAGTIAGRGDISNLDINPYITGSQAFTTEQLQGSRATGLGKATAAQREAALPYDIAASQRALFNKQQPGARTGGVGESSVTSADISQMEKRLYLSKDYSFTDTLTGKKGLTDRGQDVLYRAGTIMAGQKKKNPLLSIKQAVEAERRDYKPPVQQFGDYMNRQDQQAPRYVAPQQPQAQPAQPTQPRSAIQPGENQSVQVKSVIQTKLQSQTPQQVRTELQTTYQRKLKKRDPSAEYFNPANYPELK